MKKLKDINLSIKSNQCLDDEDAIKSELFTTANLYKSKNKWIISYENDSKGISEIILWGPKKVILNSDGDIKYSFKLIEGQITQSNFKTQDLFACIDIKTLYVDHNVDSSGGSITLEYEIIAGPKLISKNQIYILLECS